MVPGQSPALRLSHSSRHSKALSITPSPRQKLKNHLPSEGIIGKNKLQLSSSKLNTWNNKWEIGDGFKADKRSEQH